MTTNRNKLYTLLLIASLAGYIWLYLSMTNSAIEKKCTTVCLLKRTTNIPCPSCGSTRSIISLAKGNFLEAVHINPLGYVIALIMIVMPVWIMLDLLYKRKTFFDFYHTAETYLRRPPYAIPMVLLVIVNWIWNITKDL